MKKQKYFKKDLSYYLIISVKSPLGVIESWAKQLTYEESQSLANNKKYQFVDETSVSFEGFLVNPDLDDAGYPDPIDGWNEEDTEPSGVTLKEMLERLNNRPTDGPTRHWSIQFDDDMNRHERLKASMLPPDGTVGRAEDILAMIRARQETVEMPPTVMLNENKYPDSTSLGQAIDDMKQRHGDHAHIRIGKHGADDLLATYKNQETIGLSSVMDSAQGINIDFDAETLELIMKMKPKK